MEKEMKKKDVSATSQLKRIAALPYNHYFGEEVGKIRQKYAVPKDNTEARDWFFFDYSIKYKKKNFPFFLVNSKYQRIPSKFRSVMKTKAQHFGDTEVPLEIDIMDLL